MANLFVAFQFGYYRFDKISQASSMNSSIILENIKNPFKELLTEPFVLSIFSLRQHIRMSGFLLHKHLVRQQNTEAIIFQSAVCEDQ